MKNLISIFLILAVTTAFLSTVSEAQTTTLKDRDKKEIVTAILQKHFQKEIETAKSKEKKEVYIFATNVSPKQLPQSKNFNFVIITEKDVERIKKTGGDYYYFGEFLVKKSIVYVDFEYVQIGVKRGFGPVFGYRCRKTSNLWEVKEYSKGIAHFYL